MAIPSSVPQVSPEVYAVPTRARYVTVAFAMTLRVMYIAAWYLPGGASFARPCLTSIQMGWSFDFRVAYALFEIPVAASPIAGPATGPDADRDWWCSPAASGCGSDSLLGRSHVRPRRGRMLSKHRVFHAVAAAARSRRAPRPNPVSPRRVDEPCTAAGATFSLRHCRRAFELLSGSSASLGDLSSLVRDEPEAP